MNETNPLRRPVPHIQHSQALEDAAIAVHAAVDSEGRKIFLCHNPLDVNQVRATLQEVTLWLKDPAFYLENESPAVELTNVDHVILLANLLREHLRAGNLK
jgi:hypothetical protein